MLCLAIEFLTGYCVATHPSARDKPEWPPHPARVFMAMAAAYFETGEDPAEKTALEFIESLPLTPNIIASHAEERSPITYYVPVNDKLDVTRASFPIFRSRQPREFPRVRPDDPIVYYCWPNAIPDIQIAAALRSLCGKITRIGHSSSLVRAWITDQLPEKHVHDQWIPDESEPEKQLRAITPGCLDELRRFYRAEDMVEFDRLDEIVRTTKEKKKKAARDEPINKFVGTRPLPIRPDFQVTTGYRVDRPNSVSSAHSAWSEKLLIFRLEPMETTHPRIDILSAPALVYGFRRAMIKMAETFGPIPEYISGHKPGPDSLPSEQPHCLIIPLPFTGRQHADGHIIGVAVAMPNNATATERLLVRRTVAAISEEGLVLGRIGRWKLIVETEFPVLYNLRPEVWTGAHQGKRKWASVTPIAFDEHPKSKSVDGYQDEVREMIKKACLRIGLPSPECVEISHVSFIRAGVPTAYQFPRLARKDGSQRRQLHARIIFSEPVIGPILLGSGRYRGYGLFRPLLEETENG